MTAPAEMTPDQLRSFVERSFRTHGEAAEAFGVSYRTLSRWLAGHTPIPATAVKLIEMMKESAD
jgi:DNA-binding transcriptional regulator YiaG